MCSGPLSSGVEEAYNRLKIPAWDILEATPFVLDAALTACSRGKLSPRELATGLKDLADFLPATLATIVSYFAAEVTRGVWKAASMNGSTPLSSRSETNWKLAVKLDVLVADKPW